MNEFRTYHPLVNFIYFVAVIGFSCFFMHPVCLGISFAGAFTYSLVLGGRTAFKKNVLYMLPVVAIAALMNPMFNHQGATILSYLPSGNPLTLESIVYGFVAAVMIVTVICWFSCYNEVMTSDKFIYLFGKVIPSLSLIFSMTLRFVPRFLHQTKLVANSQRCIGRDMSEGGIVKRAKNGLSILSIIVTWALENSIETADSMRSRGYGLPGRTAFSIFKFSKRDVIALICIAMSSSYVLIGGAFGAVNFEYFPSMIGKETSLFGITVYIAYFALCVMPIIIELKEVCKWKAIKSVI